MTAKTAKVVNYTPEQTSKLVEAYKAQPTMETVEQFAQEFGKTVRSVVAKLSREKVYVSKAYVSKNGEKPVLKNSLADELAKVCELTEAEADSLTKANKTALAKILAMVKPVEVDEAE